MFSDTITVSLPNISLQHINNIRDLSMDSNYSSRNPTRAFSHVTDPHNLANGKQTLMTVSVIWSLLMMLLLSQLLVNVWVDSIQPGENVAMYESVLGGTSIVACRGGSREVNIGHISPSTHNGT